MAERVSSAFGRSAEAFRGAVGDGCGLQVVSVVLVGSVTTGEARFDREPPSDIDVLIVVDREASAQAARCCREATRSLNGLTAGLPPGIQLGIRTRGITELDAFQAHMASWGYDMHRYARTVCGLPIHGLLRSAADVPHELVLRNMLGQLWWAVSAPAWPYPSRPMLASILARCLVELVHFALVLDGTYRANAADRLAVVQAGNGPAWLRENSATLAEAFAIRQHGNARQPPPRRLQRLLRTWQTGFFETLLLLVSRLPTLAVVPSWFPVGCCDVSNAAMAILGEATATTADPYYGQRVVAAFERAPAEISRCSATFGYLLAMFAFGLIPPDSSGGARQPGPNSLGLAYAALEALGKGKNVDGAEGTPARYDNLRSSFARIQLSRCPAAARDLEPHLQHLIWDVRTPSPSPTLPGASICADRDHR